MVDFHISPTGNDSPPGDGSAGNPWKTFIKARNEMRSSGSVIRTLCREGTYNISSGIALTISDVGTTYQAFPGETPVIDLGGGTFPSFDITGNNITLKGLTIQNGTATLFDGEHGSVRITGGATGVVVEACVFDDLMQAVIGTGISDLRLLGNVFSNIGHGGFYGQNVDDSFFAGNDFSEINSERPGFETVQSWCLFTDGSSNNNVMEYNRGVGLNGALIGMTGSTNTTIQYNEVLQSCRVINDYGGIYLFGRKVPRSDLNNIIQFNLVIDCGGAAFGVPGSPAVFNFGIYIDDGADGVIVHGNTSKNSSQAQYYNHGGRDDTFTSNVGLLEHNNAQSQIDDQVFMRWAPSSGALTEAAMTGCTISSNIMFSIDANGDPISYIAAPTADHDDWMHTSGVIANFANITMTDNIRYEDIANHTDINTETSSIDLTTAEGDGLFVDVANDDFNLAVGAGRTAALAEGFVEIDYASIGLAGYDRSNYFESTPLVQGNLVLTGKAFDMFKGSNLVKGTLTLDGNSLSLDRGVFLVSTAPTLMLTGKVFAFEAGLVLPSGALTLTGKILDLDTVRVPSIVSGILTLTGKALSMELTPPNTFLPGSLALEGHFIQIAIGKEVPEGPWVEVTIRTGGWTKVDVP